MVRLPISVIFMKGATAWEFQVGPFFGRINFPRYWKRHPALPKTYGPRGMERIIRVGWTWDESWKLWRKR